MKIGKQRHSMQSSRPLVTSCLVVAVFLSTMAARAAEPEITLNVRHDHAVGSCHGKLIMDSQGARYETPHKKHARTWTYEDIKQWQVEDGRKLRVYSYQDRKWRLGADEIFAFDWTDANVSPQQIYEFLEAHTKRPIAAWVASADGSNARYEFQVKHLGTIKGSEGRLIFADDKVIYRSDEKQASRTWRYEDLESIASAGIYDLALATYEQQKFNYASRRVYNFQLKQALPPDTYDELWRFVNRKKGLGGLP
ncbi:MAG: hypothetical protein HYX72_12720 [Acidobacteria bacterium]|nr:hypothetical protein [Acidobacteriota bacterium]